MRKKIYNANSKYKSHYLTRNIEASLTVNPPYITNSGFATTLIEQEDGTENIFDLHIEASGVNVSVDNDQIAYMIAALVLKKYVSIHFEFDISNQAFEDITAITSSTVTANSISQTENAISPRGNWSINMSGGMDSLTLCKLCPDIMPVSIKFLSPTFAEDEEGRICSELGSVIVKTNMSEFLFPHYSYGYYNIGSLLFANDKKISYAINGEILSDNSKNWDPLRDSNSYPYNSYCLNDIYGVKTIYPLLGLTKVGVYKLLHTLDPELYEEQVSGWFSNNSDDKTARIRLLLDMIITGKTREVDRPMPRVPWKLNVAYSYYLASKLGVAEVGYWIYDVPSDTMSVLENLSMDFMEKYDQGMLQYLPEDFRDYFVRCLEEAGVEFYTEFDYENRQRLFEIINAEPPLFTVG